MSFCFIEGGSCPDDCVQLTEREAAVCLTVCSSSEPVRFSFVMKAVGLHQELVSRILKRLMNHGAIEKTDGRYRRKTVSQ